MMFQVSETAIDLIQAAAGARSAAEVGRSFFNALQPLGVRAIFAREIGSAAPGEEHVYSRISPRGWEALYDEKRFAGVDFLSREVRRRATPFDWSELKYLTQAERELGEAVAEFDISGGIAAPVHGPNGYVGVTSLAFEQPQALSPDERGAVALAAHVLHLRMMELSPPQVRRGPKLSPRERDCLLFVSEGCSDWEIAERLGVSETTVVTHLQNARRKLGARTRAHAVALALLSGLI